MRESDDNEEFIRIKDISDYYFHELCEVVPMELARTLIY